METSDYPALFSASDMASLKAQRTFFQLLGGQLFIFILASALGLVPTLFNHRFGGVLTALTAVLLAIGILLMWFLRAWRPEKVWFDCRAVAESVKTATWRYMMHVTPFGTESDPSSAEKRFVEQLRAIRRDRPGVEKFITGLAASATEITDFMRNARKLSLPERKDLYIRKRLLDQNAWYESKAAANRKTGQTWLLAIIVIQTAALALAIFRIALPGLVLNPVPLLMTIAATCLAWTQAKRHEELTEPYALAAQELRELGVLSTDLNDEEKFEKLVIDVEEAISREHTMWRARRIFR